jgi:hypothetical protein
MDVTIDTSAIVAVITNEPPKVIFVLSHTINKSPLDIAGVDLNLSTDEIVDYVREGRERS